MRKNFTTQKSRHSIFFWVTTLLSISVLFFSSCSDDEEPAPTLSIMQTIQETEGLDSLYALLDTKDDSDNPLFSGIIIELQEANRTFFAPNNEAFARLVNSVGANSMLEIRTDLLRDILEYHVLSSSTALGVGNLTDGLETEFGETIAVNTGANPVALNSTTQPTMTPTIVSGDVRAINNGIIHVIDNVLLPSTITDDISPSFGTLASFFSMINGFSEMDALIRKAGYRAQLADSTKKYTVLALFNNILDNYISQLIGATGTVASISEDGAKLIAGYHIIDGDPFNETIFPSEVPTLLANDPIYITATGEAQVPALLNFNAYAYDAGFKTMNNGKAYIPISGSNSLTALSSSAFRFTGSGYVETFGGTDEGDDLTLLKQALEKAPAIQAILDGDAPYTFFTPNDTAFVHAGITSDSLTAMTTAQVEAILKNHIVTTGLLSAGELAGTTAKNAANTTLSFASSDDSIIITNLANDKTATIVISNILTNVGIVHDVDRLLTP